MPYTTKEVKGGFKNVKTSEPSKSLSKKPMTKEKAMKQKKAVMASEKKSKGKSVSWMWRGKRYSGTLIPSKEDKDNRYARTENGKIKVLPKKSK